METTALTHSLGNRPARIDAPDVLPTLTMNDIRMIAALVDNPTVSNTQIPRDIITIALKATSNIACLSGSSDTMWEATFYENPRPRSIEPKDFDNIVAQLESKNHRYNYLYAAWRKFDPSDLAQRESLGKEFGDIDGHIFRYIVGMWKSARPSIRNVKKIEATIFLDDQPVEQFT
ncbi:MAG: hypothetical protein Q9220_006912 [cf. Caloplaca sp. 1 TL-2023]